MYSDKITRSKSLETISILALACIAAGLIFGFKGLLYIALILLVIGSFFKGLSIKIARVWLKFAHFIGNINSKIILTLIFFLFLTPIAILYRVIKGDNMNLRRSNPSKSYWIEKNQKYKPKDLENVW